LLVNGTSGSGNVSVNNAGTVLGGTGTIAGAVTVNGSTIVAPGSPTTSPGTLATGPLTLAGGASYTAQINGTAAGTLYDRLNVTGTSGVSGANLNVTLGYTPGTADAY